MESGDVLILLDLIDSAEDVKAQPAGADRDQKLQELEAKIQAILKEIHALRVEEHQKHLQGTYKELSIQSADVEKRRLAQLEELKAEKNVRLRAVQALSTLHKAQSDQLIRSTLVNRADGSVTLNRTTYTLPPAKAAALAAFLKEHLKASVVETTVEGGKLTVTTTPEAQKAIGQLIGLIQKLSDSKSEYKLNERNIDLKWEKPVPATPAKQ